MHRAVTTPPLPPRRAWRVVLLVVTGAAVAGAVAGAAVYADRRSRTAAPAGSTPGGTTPGGPGPSGAAPGHASAGRTAPRGAAAAALPLPLGEAGLAVPGTSPSSAPRRAGMRPRIVVGAAVLALATGAVATVCPDDPVTSAAPAVRPTAAIPVVPAATRLMPMSTAECQAMIATRRTSDRLPDCGYPIPPREVMFEQAAADAADPRYFGASLPTALTVEEADCMTGTDRPVLETVYPTLSAAFTEAPGVTRVEPTFQIIETGAFDGISLDRPGPAAVRGARSELDLHGGLPLRQGSAYRWRVRATPQYVGGGDWSAWCDFAIGELTADHLGLDTDRKYQVVLSAGAWRTVLTATGPVKSAHALIKSAVKKASSKAEPIPVTLTGADWTTIVSGLASRASEKGTPKYWKAADAISSALGSHPHPTMGYERG
jgi:hypothetical protein